MIVGTSRHLLRSEPPMIAVRYIYARQISRWRTERPSASQTRQLDRMEEQNRQLRAVTEDVLALARELRKGTINRITEMSDNELGLQALLGNRPANRR
jgi:hypothetical protein